MGKGKWFVLIAVVLAFVSTSTANAAAPIKPGNGVACGYCDGGGVQGCATASDVAADGWGDVQGAYYHWCWNNGNVYDNYGWDYADSGFGIQFQGYVTAHDFGYGHENIGHFALIISPWFPSTIHRCIQVDGWGNQWTCRAWYE